MILSWRQNLKKYIFNKEHNLGYSSSLSGTGQDKAFSKYEKAKKSHL